MAVTVAIFEASGHCTGVAELNPTWASVHAFRPFAADGLIVMPSGSVTRASRRCAVPSPSGSSSPSCGKPRFTLSPDGESASEESG